MKDFKRGTPAFGLLLGTVMTALGALIMWIGFWKALVLVLLFAAGYFLGSVGDVTGFVKGTVGKVVPEKKEQTINFRQEIEREQKPLYTHHTGAEDANNQENGEEE